VALRGFGGAADELDLASAIEDIVLVEQGMPELSCQVATC
jgi:hypothetical protein